MCQACGSSTLNYASGNGQPNVAYGGGGGNTTTTVTATGNLNTDALLYGNRWANANLTFSFPTLATQYEAGYTEAGDSGFAAATAGMQASIRYALGLVSQYTNLNITEVDPATTTADIRVAQTNHDTGTAKAFLPVSDYMEAGDVWFGTSYFASRTFEKGRYAWATTMHELGHALGLKHGHETGGLTGAMDAAHDQMAYSLMTYRSYQGGPTTGYTNETYGYAQTFMMYDISALQAMYGANFNTNSSNSTYTWSTTTGEMFINGTGQGAPGGNRVFQTIWDGNGIDAYDFSNFTNRISVDLTPGGFTAFFSSTGFSPSEQRAYLGGSQYAPGNVFNALQYNGDARSLIENAYGGAGNDTIRGNFVANELRGGLGNDTIFGGGGNDRLFGDDGSDELRGEAQDDTLFGWSGNDNLFGDDGNDNLHGQGDNDTLFGWSGNDNLFGDDGDDSLYGQGDDDTLFGWTGNDNLFGDTGNDSLFGQAGNDRLFGWTGNDVLDGGDNDDVLNGQGGNDTLRGGNGNDNLFGEADFDKIYGGRGNDFLDGGAGGDQFWFETSDLEAGANDTAVYDALDRYVFDDALMGAISYVNDTGGARINIAVAGGTHSIFVQGATSTQLQNQAVFWL